MCIYELKYLTIQLLYCKEAVLSVVNLGINSGLSKQLLLYLYFLSTVCSTGWQWFAAWTEWGRSLRGRTEPTCVTTAAALTHAERAASKARGTPLAEQNQAWFDGLCSGRTRQPSAWEAVD